MRYRRTDRIVLWHPDSPGVKVSVRPSWLRCFGVVRAEFATLNETIYAVKHFPDAYYSGLPWLYSPQNNKIGHRDLLPNEILAFEGR